MREEEISMTVDEAVNYILLGATTDQVIEDMILLEGYKKAIGIGAGIGGAGGALAGYRKAKKNKTSKLKGALKGAGIGALGGAAIGVGAHKFKTTRQRTAAKIHRANKLSARNAEVQGTRDKLAKRMRNARKHPQRLSKSAKHARANAKDIKGIKGATALVDQARSERRITNRSNRWIASQKRKKGLIDHLNNVDEGWKEVKGSIKRAAPRIGLGALGGSYATAADTSHRYLKKNPRKEGESHFAHIKRVGLTKKYGKKMLKATGKGAVLGGAIGGVYHSLRDGPVDMRYIKNKFGKKKK